MLSNIEIIGIYTMTLLYHFDWDIGKARTNQTKHAVSFRLATTVFRDTLSITIYDDEHSEFEDRWVTMGQAENGQILVVVHTFSTVNSTEINVRIISARRADKQEVRVYEEMPR
jgi:uncharacterized DUF497 family protein